MAFQVNLTKHVFPDNIQGLFVQLNIRKSKWILMGAYKALDIYSNYENILLTGDFKSEIAEPCMIPSYINMT